MIWALSARSGLINSYEDAPVDVPFGGSKQSGIGGEISRAAFEPCSQPKSVFVRKGALNAPDWG